MVPGCVPFKIVSDSPTLHSRWLLFFKVMFISLWNLLQYHSIVRWVLQAQWAEPLVLLGLGLGFNTTFNNISIISCLLVLLVEETEISRMNICVWWVRLFYFWYCFFLLGLGFKTTFNNISIISWLLVLLVEETIIPGITIDSQ